MAFKSGNYKNLIILSIIIVICIIIITVSFKQSEAFTSVKTNFLDFFNPVQEKVFQFFSPFINFFLNVKNYINLTEKVEALELENAALLQNYSDNINLKIENDALRKLIGLDIRKEYNTAPAKVIGYYDSKWQSEIIINIGRNSGIDKGMAVLDSKGLLGVVTTVSDESSQVRLVNDPQSSLGARVLSSRKLGIVEGSVDKAVYLNYIKADEDIFKGDILVTSEFGKYIPAELLIGRISKISNVPTSPYKKITVDTFANLKEVEYVLVIKDLK